MDIILLILMKYYRSNMEIPNNEHLQKLSERIDNLEKIAKEFLRLFDDEIRNKKNLENIIERCKNG